jgi:pimeloyl-ACP methyl ester carboxylesterase
MLPTLVLLPGMDGTGDLFAPFCAALGDECETIIVRYPPNEILGYGELTTLTRSWLPGDKPFVLLAESFSGPVAVLLAAAKPRGLVGLILCASFVRNPRPALGRLAVFFRSLSTNRLPKGMLHSLLLGSSAANHVRDDLDRALKKVQPNVLADRLRSIVDIDVTDELKSINLTCLYLRASNDRLVPPTSSLPFESLVPRWRMRELSGPHLLLQVAPMAAAREVRDFIQHLAMDEKSP